MASWLRKQGWTDRAARPSRDVSNTSHRAITVLASTYGEPAGPSSSADPNPYQREVNLAILRERFTAAQVSVLLMDGGMGASTQVGLRQAATQGLLDCSDINAWREFFVGGLGLADSAFFKLLRYSSGTLSTVTPFAAGQAIMILRRLGFLDSDLFDRVLPVYPQLLSLTEEQKDEALELLAPWADCDKYPLQMHSGAEATVSQGAGGHHGGSEPTAAGSSTACSGTISGHTSGAVGAAAGGSRSMGVSGSMSVADLIRQCPSFLIPEVYKPLGIIINRIRASREGK